MKKGSVYLVVTMAATLLVLALGTPRLIRAISGNWNQASEPASQQEQNVQLSSGTEQQQHKVDNFIGKKASEVLASDQFEPWYYFETVEQYSEEFAKGVVANQSIQSGTTIGRKTTITLYVSKGSASEPLPQLVGKTPEEAIAIPVSYTHLDVYKRQVSNSDCFGIGGKRMPMLSTWAASLRTMVSPWT